MSSEEKSPYSSVTISISQMTSEKRLGQHYIKIEATMGNQKFIIFRNKDDVSENTGNIDLANLAWDAYEKTKTAGESKGHKFIEVEK